MQRGDPQQPPTPRRAERVPCTGAARLRGTGGTFGAAAHDLSLYGVRLGLAPCELRLPVGASLAATAAAVQTRLGSRFVVELGDGRGVARAAGLVRLILPETPGGDLELGCVFEEPLAPGDAAGLGLDLPSARGAPVRRTHAWSDVGRDLLDPCVVHEKVPTLFGAQDALRPKEERAPARSLRALVRSQDGLGQAPLMASAHAFSPHAALLRVEGDLGEVWLRDRRDLAEVARSLAECYGDWPSLEVVEGARRLWHGGARICGVEVAEGGGLLLRLAWSRRLAPAELERLCAA